MILRIGPYVGSRCHAVRHVVEAGDGGDVPDVAIAEPRLAQRFPVRFLDLVGRLREPGRKIEHRLLARVEFGGAIVLGDQLSEFGVLAALAQGCAVRGEAIVTVIDRTYRHRDHLTLGLGEAAVAQHQVVGHQDEGLELGIVEGVGAEHVRHEAKFLLAFAEILGDLGLQAILRSGMSAITLCFLVINGSFVEAPTLNDRSRSLSIGSFGDHILGAGCRGCELSCSIHLSLHPSAALSAKRGAQGERAMTLAAGTTTNGLIRQVQKALGEKSQVAQFAPLLYGHNGLDGARRSSPGWLAGNARDGIRVHRREAEEEAQAALSGAEPAADGTPESYDRRDRQRRHAVPGRLGDWASCRRAGSPCVSSCIPIFKTERDKAGHLQALLGPGDQNWNDGHQESYIAIHLPALPETVQRDLAKLCLIFSSGARGGG